MERITLTTPPEGLLEDARRDAAPEVDELFPFEQEEMVRWLDPRVLLAAAKETVVSALFARFADKREIQGGMPARWFDHSETGSEPVWIDYVSDTGDGFDPTYTIASLVGGESIPLDSGEELPRGRILVLGGDQVYPSANERDYLVKFSLPYAGAFSRTRESEPQPYMFALPGNHDWYDGLTEFMRLFCQRRWIGGWKTEQSRSYFAIKLPSPWWLWAVDTQFDAYIDLPQLSYFEEMASELKKTEGAKVILITAKPSWVTAGDGPPWPQPWRTLAFLEDLIEQAGASLELTLTGDLHHYSRYTPADGGTERHKVTAGGGGAYLSATHSLPTRLSLPDQKRLVDPGHERGAERTWVRDLDTTFPSDDDSAAMVRTVNDPPIRRHTPLFAVFTGALYTLLALAISVAVNDRGESLTTPLANGFSPGGALELLGDSLGLVSVLAVALLAYALCKFVPTQNLSKPERSKRRLRWGGEHILRHVVPSWIVTLAFLALATQEGALAGAGFWPGLLAGALGFAVGFFYGPWTFAQYIRRAQEEDERMHANEVFAAQSQSSGTGHKHLLRIRVEPGGAATVHAVGVREVPREWERLAQPNEAGQWFEPRDRRVAAELIDEFTAG